MTNTSDHENNKINNFTEQGMLSFGKFADPSASDFISDIPKALFNWFSSFSPALPKRGDFDIMEHWHLAAHLYIIDVNEDGSFHYRLNGEKVVDIIGYSQRGLIMGLETDTPVNAALCDHFRNIISSRKTMRCIGDLSLLDRQHVKFESIDCPLQDETGRVSHILGVIALTE